MKEKILADVINRNKFKTYIELGVWKGDNIDYISKNCPSLKLCLGVDSYCAEDYKGLKTPVSQKELNEAHREAIAKTKPFVVIFVSRISEASLGIRDKSLDIVFIDGSHDYKSVKQDIILWLPKIRKGGILCGHDYCDFYSDVKEAVDETLGIKNIEIKDFKLWFYHVKDKDLTLK